MLLFQVSSVAPVAPVPRPSDKSCVARRSAAGGHCGRGDFGTRLELSFAGFSSEAKPQDVYLMFMAYYGFIPSYIVLSESYHV